MATNYYVKKFKTTTEFHEFMNFTDSTPLEYGTGYVDSNDLVAVTQTNFTDWRDTDGLGADLAGVVILSGAAAADQFKTLGSADVSVTGTIAISGGHANLGTSGAPVNYRVYSAATTFPSTGTIVSISSIDNGIMLLYKDAAPIYF
jgi:hypothetical protein